MSKLRRFQRSGPADWSDEVRGILGSEKPPDLNILYTIGHHPHLLGPFLAYSATLAMRGVLTRRSSELLALRASWNCRSEFEWGHHAHYAREAGLSDAEIERVAAGPQADGWNGEERALLRAADELHESQRIADSTWAALRGTCSDAQLVEIPFIVGHYSMLSMVANSTDVPLEDGFDRLPEPAPAD